MPRIRELLLSLFLRAPLEFLLALIRLLLLLIVMVVTLLLKLWKWLWWLLHTKTLKPEEESETCGQVPEVLVRRPDPCIYSQFYLASQGLPVTWNNPDIWIAPAANPSAVLPDSYHLEDNTDYIVSVQAHNASTDAAIGVAVRLVYRPWSFNSPAVTPVEIDSAGREVVRSVDIGPMGAAVTQFRWHTPSVAPGTSAHYCLQAQLSHPLDVNPANNLGQENSDVYSQNPGSVAPGELAQLDIDAFATRPHAEGLRFRLDTYEIDSAAQVRLTRTRTEARARIDGSDRLSHLLPTFEPREPRRDDGPILLEGAAAQRRAAHLQTVGQVTFSSPKSRFRMVKARYAGFEALRAAILAGDYSLPPGMDITITTPPAAGLPAGPTAVGAASALPLRFEIKVPDDAQPGTRIPLNIVAEREDGSLVGGVTLFFHVGT